MQHRFKFVNIKSWKIGNQSGRKRHVNSSSVPQVTCTHIDLNDHDYQQLSRDMQNDGHPQITPLRDMEDDGN